MRINPDNKKIRYSGRIDWTNQKNQSGFIHVHLWNLNLQENI